MKKEFNNHSNKIHNNFTQFSYNSNIKIEEYFFSNNYKSFCFRRSIVAHPREWSWVYKSSVSRSIRS